jgi:hypothetical protein
VDIIVLPRVSPAAPVSSVANVAAKKIIMKKDGSILNASLTVAR